MDRLVLALTLASALFQADPPPTEPPGITLPPVSVAPAPPPIPPPPQPSPAAPTKLSTDVWYVITSNAPFLTTGTPDGVVKVVHESGPITLRGKFAEQPDLVQTKKFDAKYIVSIEAVGSGQCFLQIWPTSATTETQVIRRTLDVNGKPTPPEPPEPPVSDFQKHLQAAFALDKATSDQAKLLAMLYRSSAATDSPLAIVFDPKITTWAAMVAEMQKAVKLLDNPPGRLPHGCLDHTARVIADEALNPPFSTVGKLDDATRGKIATAFLTIAAALETLK